MKKECHSEGGFQFEINETYERQKRSKSIKKNVMEGNRVSLEDSYQRRQNPHMLSLLKPSAQCTVGTTGSRTQPKPPSSTDLGLFLLVTMHVFICICESFMVKF